MVSRLYIYVAVVVVLLVVLFLQLHSKRTVNNLEYTLFVDTPNGLVGTRPIIIANELDAINHQIIQYRDVCDNNSSSHVRDMLINLKRFIKLNNKTFKGILHGDDKALIIDSALFDSVTPYKDEYQSAYRTIVETDIDEYQDDPKQDITYLSQHIGIVSKMLRADVCDQGRIDMDKLARLVNILQQNIRRKGHSIVDVNQDGYKWSPKYATDYEPRYMGQSDLLEPMDGGVSNPISIPKPNDVNQSTSVYLNGAKSGYINYTRNGIQYQVPYYTETNDVETLAEVRKDPYNENLYRSTWDKPLVDDVITEKQIKQLTDIDTSSSTHNINTVDELSNVYQGTLSKDRITHIDSSTGYEDAIALAVTGPRYTDNQGNETLLDNSLEGQVERDVLGYRPPGHLVSQIHDRDEHTTTRVNSCLGKTIPDDKLWRECASLDVKMFSALGGDSRGMIAGTDTYPYW